MGLSATMPKARGHGIEGVQALKDQIIGPSGWREVTQEMVNRFAELSGDDQWIDVGVERAAAVRPLGTTAGRARAPRPRPEPLGSARGVELAGHQAQPALLAAAQHDRLDGNVDQVGDHQALYVVDALQARAGELDDQVLRPESRARGGAVG